MKNYYLPPFHDIKKQNIFIEMNTPQCIGIIKWFESHKGFGQIGHPELGEIFFRHSDCEQSGAFIKQGAPCIFKFRHSEKGLRATQVRSITIQDFDQIAATFDKNQHVDVEVKIKGKGYLGNPYTKTSVKRFSVILRALQEALRNQGSTVIFRLFTSYFDKIALSADIEQLKKFCLLTCVVFEKISLKLDGEMLVGYNRLASKSDEQHLSTGTVIAKRGTQTRHFLENLIRYYLLHTPEHLQFALWSSKVYVRPKEEVGWLGESVPGIDPPISANLLIQNYQQIPVEQLFRIRHIDHGNVMAEIIDLQIKTSVKADRKVISVYCDLIRSLEEHAAGSDLKRRLSELSGKTLAALYPLTDYTTKNEFNEWIKLLDDKHNGLDRDVAIDVLNSDLSEDDILSLWRETKYFTPSPEFLTRHICNLTVSDFVHLPESFVREYYRVRIDQLRTDGRSGNFTRLIFWALDAPVKMMDIFFAAVSPTQQAAMWLALPREEYSSWPKSRLQYEESDIPFSQQALQQLVDQKGISNNFLLAIANVLMVCNNYLSLFSRNNGARSFDERDALITAFIAANVTGPDLGMALKELMIRVDRTFAVQVFAAVFPSCFNLNNVTVPEIIGILNRAVIQGSERLEIMERLQTYLPDTERASLWADGEIVTANDHYWADHICCLPEQTQLNWLKRCCAWTSLGKISRDQLLTQLKILSKKSVSMNLSLACSVLVQLSEQGNYIGENILSDIALRYASESVTTVIQFGGIFEKCEGRVTPQEFKKSDYPWKVHIDGKHFPVINDTATIAGRAFPLNKKAAAISIDGTMYSYRFVKLPMDTSRHEIPAGISYCDAVRSQYEETLKKNFYWCCNSKCYNPCQTDHLAIEWPEYTLRDMIKVLDLPFSNDAYYRFLSVVNRANRLLKKLQCRGCNHLLRDARTSEFAFYRVTTFHCTNQECSEVHQQKYLTHCMNWRCNNIVDSRISKACPNGWYICDQCATCCSQDQLERRLQNLSMNAAFNPSNPRHAKLLILVKNQQGHQERGEQFDYRTGKPLE